jgi:hypothetical protein
VVRDCGRGSGRIGGNLRKAKEDRRKHRVHKGKSTEGTEVGREQPKTQVKTPLPGAPGHETSSLHRGIAGSAGVRVERASDAIPCSANEIAGGGSADDVRVATYIYFGRGIGEPGAGIVLADGGQRVAEEFAGGWFPAGGGVANTFGCGVPARTGIGDGGTIGAVGVRIIYAAGRSWRALYCKGGGEGELTRCEGVSKMECKRAGVAHW